MSLARQHVLVVDDDPMILEILSQQLESFGVGSIQTAEDGDSALAVLRQGNSSVTTLLSDVSMPGMDWPTFMQTLAEMRCQAGIILISGAKKEILQGINDLGGALGLRMIGYLNKPVMPQTLRVLLDPLP
jgi:CheY-like chemotaxis protein